MSSKVSLTDMERRELTLDLWAKDVPTHEIADRVEAISAEWVRNVVCRARARGDKRAVVRDIRTYQTRYEGTIVVPPDVQRAPPNWEGLTLVGILMGDPPRGRSALDQKRAEMRA